MNYAEYRKGAGFLPNLYRFWLSYCQAYVAVELMRFIEAHTNHVSHSNPVGITAISLAVVFFYSPFFLPWRRYRPKKNYPLS